MAAGGLAKLKLEMEIVGDKIVVTGLDNVTSSVDRAANTTKTATQRMASDMDSTTTASGRLSAGMSSLAKLAAASFAGLTLGAIVKESIDAALAVERLNRMYAAGVGDANLAGREMEYVKGVVNRLGLDMLTTAESYGKFLAAARGTTLEGEKGRKVFESVSSASTALGLTTDATSGIFNALQQMMSKGAVQAEELRGQLGERLPGAFKMSADAMGMTTAQLGKQLELGNITADELLPKLALQLDKTYGKAAVEGANSAQASINRMNNAMLESKSTLGSALMPTFTSFMTNVLTPLIGLLGDFVKVLQQAAATAVYMGYQLATGLGGILTGKAFTKKGYAEMSATSQENEDIYAAAQAAIWKQPGASSYTAIELAKQAGSNSIATPDKNAEKAAAAAAKAAETQYNSYSNAIDSLNQRIREHNPLIDKQVNELQRVDDEINRLVKATPQYETSLRAAGSALKQNITFENEYKEILAQKKQQLADVADEMAMIRRDQERAAKQAIDAAAAQAEARTMAYENNLTAAGQNSDPYTAEMNLMEVRYQREFDLINEKKSLLETSLAAEIAGSDMHKAKLAQIAELERKTHLTEKQQIIDGKKLADDAFKSKLSLATQYTGLAGDMFVALAATQDQTSRSGFESAKEMQMGAAIVNTAGAIMNALATVQPYPAALAAAAVAAATGAIQISTIASTSFGGGGGSVSAPSGSFGGGGAGGGSGLGNLVMPVMSIQDSQIQDSNKMLIEAQDRNSVVIGRLSKSIDDLTDMFKEGGSARGLAVNAPNRFTSTSDTGGIWSSAFDDMKSTTMTGNNGARGFADILLTGGLTNLQAFSMDVIARSFGIGAKWATTQAGLSVGYSDGGYGVQDYVKQKKDGGWFSGDDKRFSYTDDAAASAFLNAAMTPFINDLASMADTFKLAFDPTEYTAAAVRIQTSGKTADEIGTALSDLMQTTLQGMTLTIDGLQDVIGSYDDAYQRIKDINNAWVTANEQLQLIGDTVLEQSIIVGASMEAAINGIWGGLEGFTDVMQQYREVMYTDAERDAQDALAAQRIINTQWQGVLQATYGDIPKTIEAFNTLRDTIDTTSPLYKAVTDVGIVFGELAKATEDFWAAKIEATRERVDTALAQLSASISAEKERLSAERDAALATAQTAVASLSASVSKLRSLSDSLKNSVNSLRPMTWTEAQAQLSTVLSSARSGTLPDADNIKGMLATLSQSNTDNYSSLVDMQRDTQLTANSLAELGTLTDNQLSIEARQLATAKSQVSAIETGFQQQLIELDMIYQNAQQQVSVLYGVYSAVLPLNDALRGVSSAISAAAAIQAAATIEAAEINAISSTSSIYDHLGIRVEDDGTKYDIWRNTLTGVQQNVLFGQTPAFARGGITSGISIAGEAGPEAVIPLPDGRTVPVRLFGEADNAAAKELRSLRDEQKEQKTISAEMARHIKRFADYLDKWDAEGMPDVRAA